MLNYPQEAEAGVAPMQLPAKALDRLHGAATPPHAHSALLHPEARVLIADIRHSSASGLDLRSQLPVQAPQAPALVAQAAAADAGTSTAGGRVAPLGHTHLRQAQTSRLDVNSS